MRTTIQGQLFKDSYMRKNQKGLKGPLSATGQISKDNSMWMNR